MREAGVGNYSSSKGLRISGDLSHLDVMLALVTEPVVEPSPDRCPVGHRLGPGQVLIGWMPCDCAREREPWGHRTWTCRRCDTTIYAPPHASDY
jgi:hypothetical protein